MTQRAESSTAIVRVKGVSYNYLTFLWKHLETVANAMQQGNYPVALKLCSELIVWLPRSIKAEFLNRSLLIQKDLLTIRSNNLPVLRKIVDLHKRTAVRNMLLGRYSNVALMSFINDLTNRLDAMGYMENTKTVTEGDADDQGEGKWTDQQKYIEMKDKGKHRKNTPEGSVMT